jgi:hypothetical protein
VQYIGCLLLVLITEFELTLGMCLQPAAATLARGTVRETSYRLHCIGIIYDWTMEAKTCQLLSFLEMLQYTPPC